MSGFTCYNYQACREDIETPFDDDSYDGLGAEYAGKRGWVMGLKPDGQAHVACPYCAPSLFDSYFLYRERGKT